MPYNKFPYPARVLIFFCLSIFTFLALGTTLMDIVEAYTPYTISSRLSLFLISVIQVWIYWAVGWFRLFDDDSVTVYFLLAFSAMTFMMILLDANVDLFSVAPQTPPDVVEFLKPERKIFSTIANTLLFLWVIYYSIHSTRSALRHSK